MNKPIKKQNIHKRGFTLFIAVVVMNLLILVAFAIIDISRKEVILSSTGRDSEVAFYVADSGVECALYWDSNSATQFPKPGGTAPPGAPTCNGYNPVTGSNVTDWAYKIGDPNPDFATSTFTLHLYRDEFSPYNGLQYCANVYVIKHNSPTANNPYNVHVLINSYGYNTCNNIYKKVERAIKVEYDQ